MRLIDFNPSSNASDGPLSSDARSRRSLKVALKGLEVEPISRTVDDNLVFDDDPNKMFPPDELTRIEEEYPALIQVAKLMRDRCFEQDDPSEEELVGFGMGVLMTIRMLVKHAEGSDMGGVQLPGTFIK
jgi:hypothetical protein